MKQGLRSDCQGEPLPFVIEAKACVELLCHPRHLGRVHEAVRLVSYNVGGLGDRRRDVFTISLLHDCKVKCVFPL